MYNDDPSSIAVINNRRESQMRHDAFAMSTDGAPYELISLFRLPNQEVTVPFIIDGKVMLEDITVNFGVMKIKDSARLEPSYVIGEIHKGMFVPTYVWNGSHEAIYSPLDAEDTYDLLENDHIIFMAGALSSVANIASNQPLILTESAITTPQFYNVDELAELAMADFDAYMGRFEIHPRNRFIQDAVYINGEEQLGREEIDFARGEIIDVIPQHILNNAALAINSYMTQDNLCTELRKYLNANF